MNRRAFMLSLAAGVAVAAIGSLAGVAVAQGARPGPGGFRNEPLTPFEKQLLVRIRGQGEVHEDEAPPPQSGKARGVQLEGRGGALINLAVRERKYGVSLDGTGDVLIKNYTFDRRSSDDIYGSGLILGQKAATKGETWVSNAWIDLKEAGPLADYKRANNEAITVEHGGAMLNVRKAALLGGAESGLDNKGHVRMDAVFIASGHRPVRVWKGASLVIANSIVLAYPKFGGFWFGGEGGGETRLDYFNCRFGRVGDRERDLSSTLPDWMVAVEDDANPRITRLTRDPFDRGQDSFWVPAKTPMPQGYLKGE
ncbi:MAG TPA: hypothetical protein VGO52_23105 [Hyphomonadaceae bacterium]|jgi:hypothetical protein|nr:hypothetical protein [Hyphomonadaceae bacterium]